jgi:hypothetical protein
LNFSCCFSSGFAPNPNTQVATARLAQISEDGSAGQPKDLVAARSLRKQARKQAKGRASGIKKNDYAQLLDNFDAARCHNKGCKQTETPLSASRRGVRACLWLVLRRVALTSALYVWQVKLMPCGQCLQAHYCSRECQREDWHAGHSEVCARERERAEAEKAEKVPAVSPEPADEKTAGDVRVGPPAAAALSTAAALQPETATAACGLCGESQGPLSACGRCRSVRYCSPACQKADWRRHKRDCVAREALPVAPK